MKAILKISILIVLSVFLTGPFSAAAAIETPPNCCKIGKDVEFDGETYNEGKYVGGEDKCNLTSPETDLTDIYENNKKWGLICLFSTIEVAVDYIFIFLTAFVGVMVLLGAFNIVTAGADPAKVKKGKDYIVFAAIGLVIALLAKAVPAFIEGLLG